MADIKISQLGEALAVTDNDILPMTASGVTSKVKASTMKSYMVDDLDVSDLHDTTITTPTDDDGLVYNATAQKWENKPVVTGDLWVKNGAHNLFDNTATTQVQDGVTLTVNADKTITATSSSSTTTGIAVTIGTFDIKAGDYTLSGSPSGSTSNTYYLQLYKNGVIDKKAFENELTFNVTSDISNVTIRLVVEPNVNIGNKTFKPMLRLATDTDPTYAPYAMTNRELTEDNSLQNITASITNVTNISSRVLFKKNNIVSLWLTLSSGLNGFTHVATLPVGSRPATSRTALAIANGVAEDSNIMMSSFVTDGGAVYVRTSATTTGEVYVNGTWILNS